MSYNTRIKTPIKIEIKKGLNLPLIGAPNLPIKTLKKSKVISLNLEAFEHHNFKLLVAKEDRVKIGTPLLESKEFPGLYLVSPAGGSIYEIRRKEKRVLKDIVIAVSEEEAFEEYGGIDLKNSSRNEILSFFLKTGLFAHIRRRPFHLMATPKTLPKAIFIKALETNPYVPSSEIQINGEEEHFEMGIKALKKIAPVFIVHRENCSCRAFTEAVNVQKIEMGGPHPTSNLSVSISKISPIHHAQDYVWTVSAHDAVVIGKMVSLGHYHIEKVISVAGEGINEGKRGFFKGRQGLNVSILSEERLIESSTRLLSGDPLCGKSVGPDDFLSFFDSTFTALKENEERELFHFLRMGSKNFSSHRAYLAFPNKSFSFTTNQNGEERAFVDGSIYEKVMPLRIPTMHLIKAILAEDFDLAVQLGFLEVVPEDFALPTFICPSKIEMMDIVKKGIKAFLREMV